VSTSVTLKVLHDIVQVVMAWLDCRLWEFTIVKQRYGLSMDEDWGTEPRIEAGKVGLRDEKRVAATGAVGEAGCCPPYSAA
jgi:Plasmid pRiA4b ORF-3-like protein